MATHQQFGRATQQYNDTANVNTETQKIYWKRTARQFETMFLIMFSQNCIEKAILN